MRSITFVVVLAFTLLSAMALAAVPGLINHQGTLVYDDGTAVDTTVAMTFTIYTDSTGGTPVWAETQPDIRVNNGIFNVLLGRVNMISDTVFDGTSRWLGVQIEGYPELTPRQRMVGVGYSFKAGEADTADYARYAVVPSDEDWTIDGDNIYRETGNVGIGTTDPGSYKLNINGDVFVDDMIRIHGEYPYLGLRPTGAGNEALIGVDIYPCYLVIAAAAGIRFNTFAGTWGEKMRLTNDGYVGIGKTSPAYKLDVDGDIQAHAYHTEDIFFQKNGQELWRMYEDEDGLYLKNLETGKVFRFVLQEVEKK